MPNTSSYQITRFPVLPEDKGLPFNASDALLIEEGKKNPDERLLLINDRFGYLAVHFNSRSIALVDYKSQEKAIRYNLTKNNVETDFHIIYPNAPVSEEISGVLVKMPKSLEQFESYLNTAVRIPGVEWVAVGFMTKYFTSGWIKIAQKYFEVIEQSKAVRKARVLMLKKPRFEMDTELVSSYFFKGIFFKQYYGVFSSKAPDLASRFFIDHFSLLNVGARVLDLASGNGILSRCMKELHPFSNYSLLDDSWNAVESGKLNFNSEMVSHHWGNDLSGFEDNYFDTILCNPPFHLEFEVNIFVATKLFSEVERVLKPGGFFYLVVNNHLPYPPYLRNHFQKLEYISRNKKFDIIACSN